MSRTRWALAFGGLITAVLLLILAQTGSERIPAPNQPRAPVRESDGSVSQGLAGSEGSRTHLNTASAADLDLKIEGNLTETDHRQPVAAPQSSGVLHGQVISTDGSGVAGAQLSWTAWAPSLMRHVVASTVLPDHEVAALSVAVLSDEQGFFSFEAAPPALPDKLTALWVTHPSHQAQVVEFSSGEVEPTGALKVKLEAASPTDVLVLRDGAPIEGARIIHHGAFPLGSAAPLSGGAHAPKTELLFLRSYTTDEHGGARVATGPHKMQLVAEYGALRSKPWIGQVKPKVVLKLEQTCTISGTVGDPGERNTDWGLPRVLVHRERASFAEEIGSIAVREDGTYGPALIPALAAERYTFSLEGGSFLASQQSLDPPSAGDEVIVDFKGECGYTVWVEPITMDDEIIPGATVEAHWTRNGQRQTKTAITREDGNTAINGVPAGAIEGTVSAPGFSVERFGPILVPETPPQVHVIQLFPGVRIRGRCVRGPDPLADFEVRYWSLDRVEAQGSLVVTDSEDGTFEIDARPGDRIVLAAISPEFDRSKPVTVTVLEDPDQEVLLIVEPPLTMIGTIVNAQTQTPIQQANVTLYTNTFYTEGAPLGGTIPVNRDGTFSVSRLVPGMNMVAFGAPGYSTRRVSVAAKDECVDLGLIELAPAQTLTATLTLPEGEDLSAWALMSNRIGGIPPTRFDTSGNLTVEDAGEGSYTFRVQDAIGVEEVRLTKQVLLTAGEEWHLEFDLATGSSLRITATSPRPFNPEDFIADISFRDPSGGRCSRTIYLDEEGKAFLPAGIGPGPLKMTVRHALFADSLSGTASLLVGDKEGGASELHLNIELRERSVPVRVLDPDGVPAAEVFVALHSTLTGTSYILAEITDEKGECLFRGLPDDVNEVSLTSSSGGSGPAIPFRRPTRKGEFVELVLNTSASLQVNVHDSGAPQSAVSCRLMDALRSYALTASKSPNEAGQATFDDLAPGAYELKVTGLEHWPVSMQVSATEVGAQYSIEVRRVGGLELEFLRSDGTPAAGETVTLKHIPTGQYAADWTGPGQLLDTSLITDATGKLNLPRLPHGEFRWSCAAGTGLVTVTAGEVTERRAILP